MINNLAPRIGIQKCIIEIKHLNQDCNRKYYRELVTTKRSSDGNNLFSLVYYLEQILERSFRENTTKDFRNMASHTNHLIEIRHQLSEQSEASFYIRLTKVISILEALLLVNSGTSVEEIDRRILLITSNDNIIFFPKTTNYKEKATDQKLTDREKFNEKTKLTASAFNLVSVGFFGYGFSLQVINASFTPLANSSQQDVALTSLFWVFTAIVLHNMARLVLGELR